MLLYAMRVLLLTALLLVHTHALACGTVEGWTRMFFDNHPHARIEALGAIHCEPVVASYYDASPRQHALIANMLVSALDSGEPLERALAVKNYYVFDQLFWLRGDPRHAHIESAVTSALNRPAGEVKGTLTLFTGPDKYNALALREVSAVANGADFTCSARDCVRIDLGPLTELKSKVERFEGSQAGCGAFTGTVRVASKAGVTVRDKPSKNAKVVATARLGDYLLLVSDHKDWREVIGPDCKRGFIPAHLVRDARARK